MLNNVAAWFYRLLTLFVTLANYVTARDTFWGKKNYALISEIWNNYKVNNYYPDKTRVSRKYTCFCESKMTTDECEGGYIGRNIVLCDIILLTLLGIFLIICNLLNIITIWKTPTLQTITNTYVFNLCISDLMVALSCIAK